MKLLEPRTVVCRRCKGSFFVTDPSHLSNELCIPTRCELCRIRKGARGGNAERLCNHCGKTFVRMEIGQPTKYCSIQCRDSHALSCYQKRAVELGLAAQIQKECADCGSHFTTTHSKRKYCDGCMVMRRATGQGMRPCVDCGKVFRTEKAKRCKDCRIKAERRRAHITASINKRWVNGESLNSTNSVGAMAEMLWDLYCARAGIINCKAVTEQTPGFDRIAIIDGVMTRIQVKGLTGSRFDGLGKWELGGGWARINWEAIDRIAIVDIESGWIWNVPKGEMRRCFVPSDYEEYQRHALIDERPSGG